jgi:predicted lipoprotein
VPGFAAANKKHLLRLIAGVLGLCLLFYLVPLFHVVPLKAARQQSAKAAFDATAYVDSFWQGPLLESAQNAVDAAELLAAFRQDPGDAVARYGHRLGLSGNASFFVSGTGRIVAADDDAVSIALQEGDPAEVVIEIGPVFGNAIRDGSGLLDVSSFANAQDFNAISAEINRRVEEQVFPVLAAKATVGATVHFVGGVDVADSEGAPSSLNLVPVIIEFP